MRNRRLSNEIMEPKQTKMSSPPLLQCKGFSLFLLEGISPISDGANETGPADASTQSGLKKGTTLSAGRENQSANHVVYDEGR